MNGNLCKVGWLADDNNIPHVNNDVKNTTVNIFEKKFEKISRKTGKNNTFWGMDIEFLGIEKVDIITPQVGSRQLCNLFFTSGGAMDHVKIGET